MSSGSSHVTMSRSWIVVCLWRAWAGVHHHSSWNQPPPRDMAAFPTWRNVTLAEREPYALGCTPSHEESPLGFITFLEGDNSMGIPIYIYIYIDLYQQLLLWRGTISMEIPLVEVEEFLLRPAWQPVVAIFFSSDSWHSSDFRYIDLADLFILTL